MCCKPHDNSGQTPGENVSIENVGGGIELYVDGTGPNPFQFRTLIAGSSISIIEGPTTVTIANTDPGSGVTLTSAGGTETLVNDGIGPALATKGLSAGAGISLAGSATAITIASTVTQSTCANVGTGAQVYLTGSTGPFNFRSLVANDSRLTITQNADNITLGVNSMVSNEGGFVEVYDTSNSTLSNRRLRTLQSSDASVTIVQNSTNIDFRVASAASVEGYYSAKNDIVTTNGTAYVVVSVMDAVANGNAGETWVFVASCEVCHPPGLTTVNSRIRWDIETSTNVWSTLETDMNICEPITIGAGQRSSPRTRTYQAVLGMNAPRLRLLMSMSAAVATGGEVEYAQVSGFRRTV